MRNPKGKTHTNKRVKYDICNKLLIRETLPLILANLEVNSYQCTQHIKMWSMVGSMNISVRLSQYTQLANVHMPMLSMEQNHLSAKMLHEV